MKFNKCKDRGTSNNRLYCTLPVVDLEWFIRDSGPTSQKVPDLDSDPQQSFHQIVRTSVSRGSIGSVLTDCDVFCHNLILIISLKFLTELKIVRNLFYFLTGLYVRYFMVFSRFCFVYKSVFQPAIYLASDSGLTITLYVKILHVFCPCLQISIFFFYLIANIK